MGTSSTATTAKRCAASPACRPNCKTSPRSSTGNCGLSASCSSASGPKAPCSTPRTHSIELKLLAETAGSEVLDGLIQRRDKPDPATYIGSGKAKELRDIVSSTGADTVICDGELAPGQLRQLEQVVKVKVVDRTALILDIFAQHARSKEGKAQVELAQMTYLLPRLRGWGESLSRQAGGQAAGGVGIGGRGPGETKIETDRRRIRARMAKLRREIADMSTARDVKRQERRRGEVPSVAITGYTNAGKSSLLNRLTGAGVLVENQLFATLDPTVRRAETSDGRGYTLTDTVGFVRHLPHQLVEAFRSTLEEVAQADLVVHVVDGADADPFAQLIAVREVLKDIDATGVPELVVINKVDIADAEMVDAITRAEQRRGNRVVALSARTGVGVDDLIAALDDMVPRVDVLRRRAVAVLARPAGRAHARARRRARRAAHRRGHPHQGERATAAGRRTGVVAELAIRAAEADRLAAHLAVLRADRRGAGDLRLPTRAHARAARSIWMEPAPSRVTVAVLDDVVVGSAKAGPNRPGPGSHVATASFMVDPAHAGKGIGRALGRRRAGLGDCEPATAACSSTRWSRRTPARCTCGNRSGSRSWRPCRRRSTTRPTGWSACTSCIAGFKRPGVAPALAGRTPRPAQSECAGRPSKAFDQCRRDRLRRSLKHEHELVHHEDGCNAHTNDLLARPTTTGRQRNATTAGTGTSGAGRRPRPRRRP